MLSIRPLPKGDDDQLVARLREGDEAAFMALVDRHHGAMLRLAMSFVRTRAVAEEVVQETWLAVLNGLAGFEGRASLKTWIFRILVNRAKTRGVREARTVPFSALGEVGDETDEPTVDPDRFLDADHRWAGHWSAGPGKWNAMPHDRLIARETMDRIRAAIAELPERQRQVIVLRDIEGFDADETCDLLDLTEGNQRVLLHRARAKVRAALEDYFQGGSP